MRFKIIIKGSDTGRAEWPCEAENFDKAEEKARELIDSGGCPYEDPYITVGGHLVWINGEWVDVVGRVKEAVALSPTIAYNELNRIMSDWSVLTEVPPAES